VFFSSSSLFLASFSLSMAALTNKSLDPPDSELAAAEASLELTVGLAC
jgi:hypothetical protein